MFATRREGDQVVRGLDVAERQDGLHALRERQPVPGEVGQAYAVPLPRLPGVFQPQDRDAHGGFQAAAARLGLGDLPGNDEFSRAFRR